MSRKETESTRFIDMGDLARKLGEKSWTSYDNSSIPKCVKLVDGMVDEKVDTVQLVGHIPIQLAMQLTALLYPRVKKLEWGPFMGGRTTIFEAVENDECPELIA